LWGWGELGRLEGMVIKLHSRFAVHPGAWLRAEVIDPHGLSVTDAAAKVCVRAGR
jgi:antitoxin HigA-1